MQLNTTKAIFLDRDGTLIRDEGTLSAPDQAIFFDFTFAALAELQRQYRLFIVTNQPGVSNGDVSLAQVEAVNAEVCRRLAQRGVYIEKVFVCPHTRQENCACIKPKPLFLQQAAEQFGLDLSQCISIGDHPHDALLAMTVGGQGIYVLTGHGRKHLVEAPAGALIQPNIAAAAAWLMANFHCRADRQRPQLAAQVSAAARVIRQGGLAAFPTETVYGLGANALEQDAVIKIFEAKNRPLFDPLIVHIASVQMLLDCAAAVPDAAWELIERFWPGPLTIVLPKKRCIPDIVTAGLPTAAFRMPAHPAALELIKQAGVPIAAPSANPFGFVSPTCAEHVRQQLADKVELIVDGGPCAVGVESTIVSWVGDTPTVLRFGGVPIEEIEAAIGAVAVQTTRPFDNPAAPGMLASHYAPRTPLRLMDRPPTVPSGQRVGLITLTSPAQPEAFAAVEVLSETADLRQAACRLFAALRRLDQQQLDWIAAVAVPDIGLGRAINDRLRRASCHRPKKTVE